MTDTLLLAKQTIEALAAEMVDAQIAQAAVEAVLKSEESKE